MKEKSVIGTHTPYILDDTVADLAFGLILSSARRIAELDRYVREENGPNQRTMKACSDLMSITGRSASSEWDESANKSPNGRPWVLIWKCSITAAAANPIQRKNRRGLYGLS